MNNTRNIGDPFLMELPSVFLISTPFQAMCAFATIKQMQINDYKIIAHLPKGMARNAQVEEYLKKCNLPYITYTPNRISLRYYHIMSLRKNDHGYNRLFIGNHNDVNGFCRACSLISDGASIVYLDDGVQSISHFKGVLLERKSREVLCFLDKIKERRKFELFRNYLSIYDGIDNNSFIIRKLDLQYVIDSQNNKKVKGVIIVGLVLKESCKIYNMTEGSLIKKIEELICRIKKEYPQEPIIYIPHGRDESLYAKDLCEKHNCEFRKCSTMIEIALMEDVYIPKAIFGYTSSALFSLKEIFPQTRIINVVYEADIKNAIFQETEGISQYYSEHGIEKITEKV